MFSYNIQYNQFVLNNVSSQDNQIFNNNAFIVIMAKIKYFI